MDKQAAFIILSPGFPQNEAESTCLPAQQLFVKLFSERLPDLQTIVLSFQYPFTEISYEWRGVNIIPLNGRNKGKLHRLKLWAKAWRTLQRLQQQYHIVGVLSFWCTECALVGKWFSRYANLQHYCWILGQDARATNRLVKLIRPSGHNLIAMSDFLKDEFYKNHGISPAHVIPNGVDKELFSSKPVQRDIDLLSVGSLIPLKQHTVFLKIVQQLKKQRPHLQAVICGKGPERDNLQTLIKHLELERTVQLVGEKEHSEVVGLMRRAKVLLHPSSYEGFSGVCIEAVSAGAAVVSFCRAMNHPISNWYIVKTEEEMIEAVAQLWKATNVSEPLVTYTMEDSVTAVINLYEDLKVRHQIVQG